MGAVSALWSSFALNGYIGKRTWRNVIEDEGNPILGTLVHHAVPFLVVNLVSLSNFELVRSAIDREPHSWVRRNRHMNAVTAMERLVHVTMGLDFPAGNKLGRHCTDNLAARRIVFLDDFLHEWQSDMR